MTKPPRRASGRVDWKPWRKMRANHLALYPECRACGEEEGVVDLLTLCAACHEDLHKRLGSTPSLARQVEWLEQTRALL